MTNKNILKTSSILSIAALMFAALSTQVATADPSGSNPKSATITRDAGCFLFDGNDALVFASKDKAVVTNSGRTVLKCQADVTPPPDGKAHVMTGFDCYAAGTLTTNTHSIVSASGKSTLTCRV